METNKSRLEIFVRIATQEDKQYVVSGVNYLIGELRNLDNPTNLLGVNEAYDQAMKTEEPIFIAQARNGEICGFLAASRQNALHCGGIYWTIQELWVDPSFRSNHIGSLLINHMEHEAQKQGCRRIDVGLPDQSFNTYSQTYNFYSKQGYVDIGIRMKKTIE